MSSEEHGRGGGRGGGRGRGRGGRGGGGRGSGGAGRDDINGNGNGNTQQSANFAGRGPKDFSANNNGGGGGRGGGGRGRGGPKHFGNGPSRPDRIVPQLPTDASDDEAHDHDDDDDDNTHIGELENDQNVDHITPINASSTTLSPTSAEHMHRARHAYCLICYSSKLHTKRTIAPCGHDDVCWACHLQMRYLHSDIKCPVCKASNETLIVDTDNFTLDQPDAADGSIVHHKRFDQYSLWGNDLGGGFAWREDVGMHFPARIYERRVLPLLGYGCGISHCEFTNWGDSYVNEKDMKEGPNNRKAHPSGREVKKRLTGLKALKAHLRIDHGYCLCDLCVENKRDFVSKLVRYTPQGLKAHQSKGDGDQSGFSGHPLCEFCKPLRFYDIVKLHEHLNKEHYKCHICEKQGKANQFFKDYPRLERHFDREHYLCHDGQCLSARFVVFDNEIDLRGHEASVHGTNRRDGGTKIKLEFRVRREGEEQFQQFQNVPNQEDFQFGLNGEAFVPDALPGDNRQVEQQRQEQHLQEHEPEISHPLHAARTAEFRAQAARVRERDGANAAGSGGGGEAFPALGMDASENNSGMLVGWTSDGARSAATTNRAGNLRRTPIGKVTQEEFPSLGPGPSAAARNRRAVALGLGSKANQPKSRLGGFSAVTASNRPVGSTPITSVSYGSSAPQSAPDMTRNNFPSLGGGPRPYNPTAAAMMSSTSSATAPNMKSANNFPSLGGGPSLSASNRLKSSQQNSNPYAAAQAHARKLNVGMAPGSAPPAPAYSALSSSFDFPAPPTTTKKNNVKAAFEPRKPPPMNNVLQFPPPSSSSQKPTAASLQQGKSTVDSLKQILGKPRYKQLKILTGEFASGSLPPERYVDDAASLFDRGITDESFWQHIPSLIHDIPNENAVQRAMRHLESVRVANQMQEMEFFGSSSGVGGGGGNNKKKPINYVLPAKKKTNSWGGSGGQQQPSKLGAQQLAADAAAGSNTTTTKKKDAKKGADTNVGNGAGKKNKAKKKNNELKSLAFSI